MSQRSEGANHPAVGKAGIAPLFAIEHHRPGLPEPGCSAAFFRYTYESNVE